MSFVSSRASGRGFIPFIYHESVDKCVVGMLTSQIRQRVGQCKTKYNKLYSAKHDQ